MGEMCGGAKKAAHFLLLMAAAKQEEGDSSISTSLKGMLSIALFFQVDSHLLRLPNSVK